MKRTPPYWYKSHAKVLSLMTVSIWLLLLLLLERHLESVWTISLLEEQRERILFFSFPLGNLLFLVF